MNYPVLFVGYGAAVAAIVLMGLYPPAVIPALFVGALAGISVTCCLIGMNWRNA